MRRTTERRATTERRNEPHQIIVWMRRAGIAAELFGWGSLLLEGWFWFAVVTIYAGFALLAIDAWFEPKLTTKWKTPVIAVLVGLAAIFSWVCVFVDAPVDFGAIITDAPYPAGTNIAGISFRPEFTELRLLIKNPTTMDYKNLNIVIQPTVPVAAIAQLTNVSGVSFEDKNGVSARMTVYPGPGKATAVPQSLLATDVGYRMRCERLLSGQSITVIIALADMKTPPPSSLTLDDVLHNKDNILRIKIADSSSSRNYWYGHPDGDVYTPRPDTQAVFVDGKYEARYRERSISQKITVAGHIASIH
jgi:hypothetical protein